MARHLYGYRFQKCTDVERELPIFEVLTNDGTTILDISMNEKSKEIEVLFHEGIAKTVVSIDRIREIIDKGERLLKSEAA